MGLIMGSDESLQFLITSYDYALTVLHVSQMTVRHTMCSQSVKFFSSRCLVTYLMLPCLHSYRPAYITAAAELGQRALNCRTYELRGP
jgi:hypothetical protein